MRFYTQRSSGFTLYEIIIVVGIIAILAAVVIASLQEAKKKSRDTARISDISEIQLALRLYKDSYDGYPSGHDAGTVIGEGGAIDALLLPYLPSTPRDPLGPTGTVYEYVYDTSYVCGGSAKKVLYARTVERTVAGNWATVCGAPYIDGTSASSTYGVILQ